jgi:nitric oxide reductase activation protein
MVVMVAAFTSSIRDKFGSSIVVLEPSRFWRLSVAMSRTTSRK